MALLQEMQRLRLDSVNEEYENFKNEIRKLIKDNPKINSYNLTFKHQEPSYSNMNLLIRTRLMEEGFVVSDYNSQDNKAGLTIIVPLLQAPRQ